MRNTTFNFTVEGDSYDELSQKAESAVNKFLASLDEDDFEDERGFDSYNSGSRVNYELLVHLNQDFESEYSYTAEVIAKIRETK